MNASVDFPHGTPLKPHRRTPTIGNPPGTTTDQLREAERLFLYAGAGLLEKLKALLEKPGMADGINLLSTEGRTALHEAVYRGHTGIVKLFLQYGGNPAVLSAQGLGALHVVSAHGDCEIAELLLGCELINVNLLDSNGSTALHMACLRGQMSFVKLLLDHGASHVLGDYDSGMTPLICAAAAGHVEVALELVKRGAEVSTVTEAGMTAMHWAAAGGHSEMIRALAATTSTPSLLINLSTPKMGVPIFQAIGDQHIDAVRTFLTLGAEVQSRHPKSNRTPLDLAKVLGNATLVGLLSQKKK